MIFLDKENRFFKDFRSKYFLDDFQIFRFFKNPLFYQYMNENFRVLPFLLDNKRLIAVSPKISDLNKY